MWTALSFCHREELQLREIIVIQASDPDGSLFQAVVNALKGKRAKAVHVADPIPASLRIGDLEIYLDQQWMLMAGREVRLNQGEYAI